MSGDVRRLGRWLVRAQPPRAALWRAVLSGLVASVTTVGLFVGAVALLVVSATRPGLRAVAGILIVIEVLAFLRSPVRFNERLSAHRLGFAAVTRWRRWLVESVGHWSYSRWARYAAGDLLERSLRDTDELQDLWLRGVVPAVSAVATLVLGDVVLAFLPPQGRWWPFAALLALVQALGVAGLVANVGPSINADGVLRRARADYQATLVELSAAAPELTLLGAGEFLHARALARHDALRGAEAVVARQRRASLGVALAVSLAALGTLALRHPRTSPTWIVVAAMLSLASFELLGALRGALETAVAVSAAAERLEALETEPRAGHEGWPADSTLRADDLTLREGGLVVVRDTTLQLAPGQRTALVGSSGSGKSTVLRALCDLDEPEEGLVSIGGTLVAAIDEAALRAHVVYLPSEPGLTRGFATDVLRLGRECRRDPFDDLRSMGLDVEPSTRWSELSRGERQRVAIARALVSDPTVVLLDEPTSGLGREETAAVLELLASTGAMIVVATHDPLVVAWSDVVLELRDGELAPVSR